jgi:hypothetical protein
MNRIPKLAAATISLVLIAGACTDDDPGAANDPEVDVELDDDVDEDAPDAGPTAGMTDAELVAYLNGLSDDEFDRFTADLSDDEYDEILTFLDNADSGDSALSDDSGDEGDDADDGSGDEPEGATPPANADPVTAGELTATRDDVDCSAENLDVDESTPFISAHVVVDGRLGVACLGETDQRLVDAWNALAVIAPAGQLADIGIFGGYESAEETDEITLAFVSALDSDGTLFQMAVNLQSAVDDPVEAQLTMAHEFSHVFTALPSQIDRTDEAFDNCSTYFSGEGCYTEDSIMYQWITEFWDNGLIDQIDPDAEATGESGQARCDADAGFFGAYAASNPEEDFAESFSAYVFAIETFSPEQQGRINWIAAQPGLAEYRERAVAAGIETPPNNFDECGLG